LCKNFLSIEMLDLAFQCEKFKTIALLLSKDLSGIYARYPEDKSKKL